MKIVDASPWEKRNLGMNAWEIDLADEGALHSEDVLDLLEKPGLNDAYVVVKLPVGNISTVHHLEKLGFNFMEVQLKVVCDLGSYECPTAFRRFEGFITCREIDHKDDEWQSVIDRITDEMFVSDRIYLDPLIPRGTSARRYRNWIADMRKDVSKSMIIARIAKTGVDIGFDVMSFKDKESTAVIGGVFAGRAPVGIAHLCSLFAYLRSRGCDRFVTSVSSNNLPILKCYTQLGGCVIGTSYVLRRMGNGHCAE